MSNPNTPVQDIKFEEVEQTIAGLDKIWADLNCRRATAGSVAADLALRFCIEFEQYKSLKDVRAFWDELDENLRNNQGQLAMFTTYHDSGYISSGRLQEDNKGITLHHGRIHLPIKEDGYFVGDRSGRWDMTSRDDPKVLSIGSGYKKDTTTEGHAHPDALNGHMNIRGAYYAISFALGNTKVKDMIDEEYRLERCGYDPKRHGALSPHATRTGSETFRVDPESIFDYLQTNVR